MYTKLVENHRTGFLVHLFWRSPCPVSQPPPVPVRGRHGPVRARGTEKLPHSLRLLPSLLQCTDNEARESAMSLWLFCSQEAGWSQPLRAWLRGCLWPKWLLLLSPCSSPCQMAVPFLLWSPLPSLQIPSNGCHSHFSGCNHLLPRGLLCARSLYWQAAFGAPKKGQWEGWVGEQNWFCCSPAAQWVILSPISRRHGGKVAWRHLQGSLRVILMQQAGRSLNGERFCTWYDLQDLNKNE